MIATILTISSLVSIMFFFVGGMVGWLAKEHVIKTTPYHPDTVNLHPEEAGLLILVKDKRLIDAFNINRGHVEEAYPDIQWGGRS